MLDRSSEVEKFGVPDVVTTSSAIVLTTALSIDSDTAEWINSDNVDLATAILTFTPSAITTAGDSIKLYASRNLIDGGAVSETFPTATFKHNLLGEFFVEVGTGEQSIAIEIQLDNCMSRQGYEFAIENALTTVSVNTGWVLTVIPKTKGIA